MNNPKISINAPPAYTFFWDLDISGIFHSVLPVISVILRCIIIGNCTKQKSWPTPHTH